MHNFIPRQLGDQAIKLTKYFPVLYIGGPRQSGKTTLVKDLFGHLPYANLENPDTRLLAEQDPRRFLKSFDHGAVLDEAQRVPKLFSYLQDLVDSDKKLRFILSGSQNFLMMTNLSQSLAGRVGILRLFPFSISEIPGGYNVNANQYTWQGGYPALYDTEVPAPDFFPSYIETYLNRDVRLLQNIGNRYRFSRFTRLCAGRAGSILNISSLARDCDIAVNTAKDWLSVLEASYIIFRLNPYYKSYNKRLIKSPKIYFVDTGLLCNLLGIVHPTQLDSHFLYGNIVENMIVQEFFKKVNNAGEHPKFWYWRDSNGHEIDLIWEQSGALYAAEVKSSMTFRADHFKHLSWLQKHTDIPPKNCSVFYLGDHESTTEFGKLVPWKKALLT